MACVALIDLTPSPNLRKNDENGAKSSTMHQIKLFFLKTNERNEIHALDQTPLESLEEVASRQQASSVKTFAWFFFTRQELFYFDICTS